MSEAEIRDEEDEGELVHWFDRPPVELNGLEMVTVVATAFAAGAAAAIGILAITGRLRH